MSRNRDQARCECSNDFTELKAAVGTEVSVSDWIEITQERINKGRAERHINYWVVRPDQHDPIK
jgi:hypothetical protein